jgi:hypothetical protein
MGHRDSSISGHGRHGGYPRHHLEEHALVPQKFRLLATAAKKVGVPALKSYHDLSRFGQAGQQAINLRLAHKYAAMAALARVHHLDVRPAMA